MGFRFRKNFKVAPGVKLNLGKKGASVTVGNKYARKTYGKNRTTTSYSVPGTGVSYVKQQSNNKSKVTTSKDSVTSSNNIPPNPNQPMSMETALRIVKWTFYALLAFIIFMMSTDSKTVFIGALIIVIGMVLTRLKRKAIINFKPTWLISLVGWIMCFALWNPEVEPKNDISNNSPENEIDSLISTPNDQGNEVPIANDTTDPVNKVDASGVENNSITPQSQPESVVPPVAEQPVNEPEPVVEQPVNEPIATTPSPKTEYFKNCTALRAVYPSGVASDHPAYASKHDRDKDGWACE